MTPQTEVITQTVDESLDWQPPMPPTDLIFNDGVPLESNRHRIAMNLLIISLKHHWAERSDFFVGGNMFVYYSSQQVRNKDFRGPDFFAVLDVQNNPRRDGWVVWEENGRYPDVIIELLSDSTEAEDLGKKKRLYEQVFKTKDYFVFHPFRVNSLQGWHLDSDKGYQPIDSNPQGWLWCQALGLWVGTWSGMVEDDNAVWLRFYDEAGNVVLLPQEAQKLRADAEQQRADQEAQRADQETQRADQETQRAEQETQRAEQETQRAEQEAQRAEQEAQRAEQEREARLTAVSRLLQMGLSTEQVALALSLPVEQVEAIRLE